MDYKFYHATSFEQNLEAWNGKFNSEFGWDKLVSDGTGEKKQAWLMFGSTDDEPMAATKKYPNLPESPYVDNRWSGYWSTTSGRMKSIKNTKRKQESAGGRDDEQEKNEHIIEAEV